MKRTVSTLYPVTQAARSSWLARAHRSLRALLAIALLVCITPPLSAALPPPNAWADDASALAETQRLVDEGDAACVSLADLANALVAAYDELSATMTDQQGLLDEVEADSVAIKQAESACESARAAADTARNECATFQEEVSLIAILRGEMTLAEVETRPYYLEKVAEGLDERAASVEAEISELETHMTDLRSQATSELEDRQNLVDACTEAAIALDEQCSTIRSFDREAESALGDSDSLATARSQLSTIEATHEANRDAAQSLAGEWFDILDDLGGVSGALTFGTGADFALGEDEFVAKWGAVIDAFYASKNSPLEGYGAYMAKEAYRTRIDPRLCAAVSMAESSGGLYCIRSHNAWGWGAADRDPYNLAYEWASWEEAITAWHEGMVASTAMYAAPSISALGDIYASDPAWPAHVISFIRQIDEFV